jgi:hypothetical protein
MDVGLRPCWIVVEHHFRHKTRSYLLHGAMRLCFAISVDLSSCWSAAHLLGGYWGAFRLPVGCCSAVDRAEGQKSRYNLHGGCQSPTIIPVARLNDTHRDRHLMEKCSPFCLLRMSFTLLEFSHRLFPLRIMLRSMLGCWCHVVKPLQDFPRSDVSLTQKKRWICFWLEVWESFQPVHNACEFLRCFWISMVRAFAEE